jgi:hypothetical protein
MSHPIHTENYKGLTIKVWADEYTESPDQWGNTDAFIVYDHRSFSVERDGFDPEAIHEHLQSGGKLFDGHHVFPLYAYIHSGVSLSLGRSSYPFTCPWDTSLRGFVLVKRQKGWSWNRTKAEKVAQSIVSEWNDYLSGNVYTYTVEDSQGNNLDACAGFYGDYDSEGGALDQAREAAHGEYLTAVKRHLKKVATWITNRVPLINRTPFAV